MHPDRRILQISAKLRRLGDLQAGGGRDKSATMSSHARTRVRQRIKALLEQRGQTNRAFAQWLGHKDQWASNLLAGRFALSLDEIDRAAAFLNVPPSDLVKVDDADGVELSPSERRVVNAMRMLPLPVRDHLMLLADYLVGVTPAEVELLATLRKLSATELRRVAHWADVQALGRGTGPVQVDPDGPAQEAAPPAQPARRTRAPK
jgi:transcriptional regulator with XRE-family HTH domain